MIEELSEQWPVLNVLAVAYFNEEWPDEYELPADVVADFLVRNPNLGGALASEIQDALSYYDEAQLAEFFEALDLLVDPGLDLNTYEGWLDGVARRTGDATSTAAAVPVDVEQGRWPCLSALGRSRFGPDWRARTYSCTRLVLEEFISGEPDLAACLPAEIAELLDAYPEGELSSVLPLLGIDYDPVAALNTNRGWLTEVARFVERVSDAMNEYPALRQLIRAYFDEDWSEESGGDPRAVVTTFAVNEPDLAPRLPAEIDALLSKEEGVAAAVVRGLGPYYDIEGDGLSYAAWLTDVREEVTRVLDHGPI